MPTLGNVLYPHGAKSGSTEQEWLRLVQSVAAGDQAALHGLYERAHRPVFTLIMRITCNRETAEEVTLDVFHDVWRRARGYDPANGTVLGWVMNQARSRALDRLRFERRKKRSAPDGGEEAAAEAQAAPWHDALETKQQSAALRAALEVLSREERQAIETAYFSELTYAEAATQLSQPLGTLKTRIRSGLHKLRRALADEASEP